MHRFRKKSDAKRAQAPENLSSSSWSQQQALSNQPHIPPDAVPALPPASDFRTSLILPSLSRRFTLLRDSNGDPVSLDDMRSKLAEQRARGAEHHISEEEEELIVHALGEIRVANAAGSQTSVPATPSNTATAFSPETASTFATQQDVSVHLASGRESNYSTPMRSAIAPSVAPFPSSTYPLSMASSPSASRASGSPRYSNKRNSNNLFGSGRFHDTSYIRSVSKASVGSSRSTTSLISSDSHGGSVRSTRSIRDAGVGSGRAVTPDADSNGDPLQDKSLFARAWPVSPYSPLSALPPRLSKEFTVQQARRTSLALEHVIRDMEEEAEETIMVPRRSLSRAGTVNSRAQSPKLPDTPSAAGTPIPWMTDEARVDDRDDEELIPPQATAPTSIAPTSPSPSPGPYPRPGTSSPSPRLPGYIPGMTRPLTPRDADSDRDDGATGYSTTPRARSPAQPHNSHFSNHSLSFSPSRHHHHPSLSSDGQPFLPPSILRSSRGSPHLPPLRTTSPGLGNRSKGNSASNPQAPSPVPSPGPEERFKSDLLTRRPLSPLIGALAAGSSRPGTPSSVGAWAPSSPLAQMHPILPKPAHENDSPQPDSVGNSRKGSIVNGDSAYGESMSTTTSLSSPALPDSPFIDAGQSGSASIFPKYESWVHTQSPTHNGKGDVTANLAHDVHRDSSISSIDLGQSLSAHRPSATSAKIAARAPTPVHSHSRSPTTNTANGHDPILLNRNISKRMQKRMRSPTPPPHVQYHTQVPLALHTPSSSSNSSSNVNLNLYSTTSPLFSPILNTSASSLLSMGSSYHSGPDENIKGGWDQLVEYDSQRSAWQDILNMNSSGGGANETGNVSETEELSNPEQVLRSFAGLTKGDLAAVQTRLVADALSRRGFDPPRSPTRRRRMSSSRASFQAAQSGRESGTNSPAPPPRQATPLGENEHTPPSPESTSRANALLETVLNSIQSKSSITPTSTPASSDVPSVEPPSSTDDDSSSKLPSVSSSGRESHEEDSSALRYKALADALSEVEQPAGEPSCLKQTTSSSEPSQSHEEDSGEATEVPISHFWRAQPAPVPLTNSVQLVRDVSRKASEATAALKNPSQTKIGGDTEGTIRRKPTKRIDLQQISRPQFVSSSTSVNAIPIMHQNVSPLTSSPTSDPRSPLKFSERFKKLRGTLRTKPGSRDGDEVTPSVGPTPTSFSQMSPTVLSSLHRLTSPASPTQTLVYTQSHLPPASATEHGRFKVSVPAPPASAGPGLKGFISRFRKPRKDQGKDNLTPGNRSGHQSPDSTSPVSPPHERDPAKAVPTSPPSIAKPPHRSEDHGTVSANRARSPTPDPATVHQLFNAASQLGLDRHALDELLARSTSTSSRSTAWTQGSSAAFAGVRSNSTSRRLPSRPREDHSLERPSTPDKPPARPNAAANMHPDGEVVRRTIIFASDNASMADLSGLVRKDSTSGRPQRSSSATSIHSTGSAAREPPVPRLPLSLGRTHTAKPSDSSSFYDMYSQEQSISGVQNVSVEGAATVDNTPTSEFGQGPALEVLQLSNGQVVWSVLDSLRAEDEDDRESLFRRSMSSRGHDVNDDLEVRFKEHRRWDSKGSNLSQASYNSRRRYLTGSSGARPETKLFKTNSSTIGRLIEDLSKNMDSGSFNFMRPSAATPSTSTSFHSDASGPSHQVERDLEALLNVINPRPSS